MKRTVIVVSSNRDMEDATRELIRKLQAAGAVLLLQRGTPDVAMARNVALSDCCDRLRGELAGRDVVLMLDDDMVMELEDAQKVVSHARETGVATSAAYATLMRTLAGTRWLEGPPGRWLAGLGCLAIPAPLLLELEQRCERYEILGRYWKAFTWSAPERGVWVGEDYRLSMQLGGVHMLPLAVGHVKKQHIYPDDVTLEKIAAGGPVT